MLPHTFSRPMLMELGRDRPFCLKLFWLRRRSLASLQQRLWFATILELSSAVNRAREDSALSTQEAHERGKALPLGGTMTLSVFEQQPYPTMKKSEKHGC
jgi:hypothetical protein